MIAGAVDSPFRGVNSGFGTQDCRRLDPLAFDPANRADGGIIGVILDDLVPGEIGVVDDGQVGAQAGNFDRSYGSEEDVARRFVQSLLMLSTMNRVPLESSGPR